MIYPARNSHIKKSSVSNTEKASNGIYLDNAATSYPKPEPVYQRIDHILRHIGGNPGRSGHRMAMDASRVIFEARESAARPFNIKNASRVAADKDGRVSPVEIENAITKHTKLVSVVHASNVFGAVLPVAEIGKICRKKNILFIIDAAQTSGAMPIDVEALNVDILAATGHKSLFGSQGTGLVYVKEGIEPLPLVDGGTAEDNDMLEMPDRLESGPMNTPGIGGPGGGIEFLVKERVEKIRQYEEELIRQILEGLSDIKGIEIIGPSDEKNRTHLVSFNIEGKDPSDIGYRLDNEFGIMTRCGLHCAPYAHKTAGTYPHGAVRVSPGYFNTPNDIEEFVRAVREIAKDRES